MTCYGIIKNNHGINVRFGSRLFAVISACIIANKTNNPSYRVYLKPSYPNLDILETLCRAIAPYNPVVYTDSNTYHKTIMFEDWNKHNSFNFPKCGAKILMKGFFVWSQFHRPYLPILRRVWQNITKNSYTPRYDLTIHMRLGDLLHPPHKNILHKPVLSSNYYDILLRRTQFKNCSILSDSPNHTLVEYVKQKHNCALLKLSELQSFQIISATINTIIMAPSTFSLFSSFFSYAKILHFPMTGMYNPYICGYPCFKCPRFKMGNFDDRLIFHNIELCKFNDSLHSSFPRSACVPQTRTCTF